MPTLTAPTIPDRSLAQRRAALTRANGIRTARAVTKRMLTERPELALLFITNPAAGEEEARVIARADRHDDWPADLAAGWANTWHVYGLLMAVPKLGRVKVGRLLNRADVSPSKTLAGMTARQRAALTTNAALVARTKGTA